METEMDPLPPVVMESPQPPPPPPPQPQPLTTVTSIEPTEAHLAQVANPTTQLSPTANHPPYAEMITTAIAALKEKTGSSKTAIAKYIERVYSNLPSTHSALLTHHLKRLKNSGQLVMVKHSYKLPSSSSSSSPPRSALPQTTDAISGGDAVALPAQSTKKRGRPPKPKPDSFPPVQVQHFDPGVAFPGQNVAVGPPAQNVGGFVGLGQYQDQNYAVGPVPVVQKKKPGRPAKPKPGVAQSPAQNFVAPPPTQNYAAQGTTLPPPEVNGVVGSEAMLVSLGLAEGPAAATVLPAKRGRGRPKRYADLQQPKPNSLNQNRSKRKMGRPRKNVLVATGVTPIVSVSGKRRGRPRKDPSAVVNGPASGQPKKRGRKLKNVQQASAAAAGVPSSGGFVPHAAAGVPSSGGFVPHVVASGGVPGAVMVPYASQPYAQSFVPVHVPVPANGVAPPKPGKRRGRPPRTEGTPSKPRKLTGRPLGRPKKNASPAVESQPFDTINLKRKLEYLQLRIKQTVSIVKPCIVGGDLAGAMGALQQLEELASTVLVNDAPVNVQGQQFVPQV